MRNGYEILVGKSEGEKQLGGSASTWEDNIRTGLREIGWKVTDWIHMEERKDQSRVLVNTVMNLRVPKKMRHFLAR